MRRFLLMIAVAAALGAGGCGGDDADSPLDEALGFLPRGAPVVAAIETDLESAQYRNADRIVERFPFGEQAKEGIRESLEEEGLDFEEDVEPALGNPLVVGVPSARALTGGGDDDQFVGAVQAEDEGALEDLVEKQDVEEEGEQDGFTIYRDDDGGFFGVNGDVLVLAGDRRQLEDAIEQRGEDDRLDEDDFEEALEGLPEDALVRVYGDARGLIQSDPDTRAARRVEWVDALRSFGATASVERDALAIEFALRTDSGELSEDDLPIAAGGSAPEVVQRAGEISIGLRDARQVLEFAQGAGRAADPSGYSDFERAKRQIERRLGVSIDDDLVGQLTGDVSVNVAVDGQFGVRAELEDPAAFERTLARVADVLPRIAESAVGGEVGLAKPGPGEDFYALAQPDGDSVVFGVVDRVFVLANDPARAGRLASESPRPVDRADGSVVFSADAERVADRILERLAPQIGLGGAVGGRLFTGPLGDLTGSVEADTDGLRGRIRLEID